jgi:hypothetical protein
MVLARLAAAAALLCPLLLSTAALAKKPHTGCPAPEEVVNAGTRSEYCAPSAEGECAPGREVTGKRQKECAPAKSEKQAGKATQAGSKKKGHCPEGEKAVNAGTRSEYCEPIDGKCAAGHKPAPYYGSSSKKQCVPDRPRLG